MGAQLCQINKISSTLVLQLRSTATRYICCAFRSQYLSLSSTCLVIESNMRYHIQSRRIFWTDLLARYSLDPHPNRRQLKTTSKSCAKHPLKNTDTLMIIRLYRRHWAESLISFRMTGSDSRLLSIASHFSFIFSCSSSWDFYISFRMLIPGFELNSRQLWIFIERLFIHIN